MQYQIAQRSYRLWIALAVLFAVLSFLYILRPQTAYTAPPPETDIRLRIGEMREAEELAQGAPFHMWSIQDKYDWQQFEMNSGIPYSEGIYGMPGEDDMPEDVAIRIAKRAVQLQHGISEKIMDTYDAFCEFIVDNPDVPKWSIIFIAKDGMTIDYRVTINAYTGRILQVYAGEEGWG